jgi:hypothetical protein
MARKALGKPKRFAYFIKETCQRDTATNQSKIAGVKNANVDNKSLDNNNQSKKQLKQEMVIVVNTCSDEKESKTSTEHAQDIKIPNNYKKMELTEINPDFLLNDELSNFYVSSGKEIIWINHFEQPSTISVKSIGKGMNQADSEKDSKKNSPNNGANVPKSSADAKVSVHSPSGDMEKQVLLSDENSNYFWPTSNSSSDYSFNYEYYNSSNLF